MRWICFVLVPAFCFSADFSLVTFPKSGTHLLIKLFRSPAFGKLEPTGDKEVAGSPHHYYSIHFGAASQLLEIMTANPNHKVIVNIRDYRDVALSMLDWCLELKGAPFIHPIDLTSWNRLPREKQIESMFRPDIWGESWILEEYRDYRNFIAEAPANRLLITSFERLVGSKGGGSDAVQLEELRKIAGFLSVSLEEQTVQEIAEDLYGGTFTFRKGHTKRWESEFTSDLDRLANQVFNLQEER